MNQKKLWDQYSSLPSEAQRQVVDFIAFLRSRYTATTSTKQTEPLIEEPFVGMWRNRPELEDDALFLKRVESARTSLRAGRGVRLDDIPEA